MPVESIPQSWNGTTILLAPPTASATALFPVDSGRANYLNALMGIKVDPEAHEAQKRDNIWIERSEIRAFDASKEARTARLEKRTSENTFFEIEEGSMHEAGISD
ncbi:hypothetical protein TNCV_4888601 [Trichonephila clavipes]|nr:hypothetical protein TNCV_4888601 [Trichonephila clavipes]